QFPLEDSHIKSMAEWCLEVLDAESVYEKRFLADRSKNLAGESSYSPEPLAGRESPSTIQIRESGLSYLIKPYAGFSTGLFLDQRLNRSFLSARTEGARVLNGFAYTCGFSVACASRGARVTSIDLSNKYLEWGKENFRINQLSENEDTFVAVDFFSFL